MSYYTIIIPIFNEQSKLPTLLKKIKSFSKLGHEILIIDDGSNDGSENILYKCNYINLITLSKNKGKGVALICGLKKALNNKIVIFDGDLELDPSDIKKLMILNRNNKIDSVFGNRYKKIELKTLWDFGNNLITSYFNFMYNSNVNDALCCAKSFFKSDIKIDTLRAKKFDIDVEITSKLIKRKIYYKNVNIQYKRRNYCQGKKLRLMDTFRILFRIFIGKISFS